MSHRYRGLSTVLIAAAFGLLLAGCGGDDDQGATTEGGTTAEAPGTAAVSMGEFFVRPDVDTAAAGEITFDVTNDGAIEHEFVVLKTDLAGEELPVKGNEVDLGKAGEVVGGAHEPGEEKEEETAPAAGHEAEEHLEPGASASHKIDMEPGSYILICNIPGHYKSGQWTEFTVE